MFKSFNSISKIGFDHIFLVSNNSSVERVTSVLAVRLAGNIICMQAIRFHYATTIKAISNGC